MHCCEKVSVAVITYNSRNTIKEMLDSVAALQYSGPIELIISDDKSTDDTVEVVEEWLQSYKRLFCDAKIIQPEQNTGTTENVNRAVKAATGKYVRIIAGDDKVTPNSIQLCADMAMKENARWVIGRCSVFSTDEGLAQKVEKNQRDYDKTFKRMTQNFDEIKSKITFGDSIPAPSAFFFERVLIEQLGGFDPQYKMYEDYPFIYKLCKNNIRPAFVDAVVVEYRISGASVSHASDGPVKNRYDTDSVAFFFNVRQKDLLRQRHYIRCAYLTLVMSGVRTKCIYGSNHWKAKILFSIRQTIDRLNQIRKQGGQERKNHL